CMQGLEFPCSF
nr:immunoglobulin light chain junction region [Macaca mulatta]MOV62202.1 immunoglobulin light chain junction region [Macaca mulatta]MOV63795.1 immunoglobulin light chain junction region [Macaca mulatta]MOV64628.1 immunoglobulin light chain junction region [Macaca mulatta]MOV65013.1 immunoglobulin light chain junction region [Macaca mulatta]